MNAVVSLHSLYKVILVPVSKDNVHLQSAPYQPVVPLTELMAHAVSKELAAQATKPVPFILGEYTANEFPHLVDFTIKTVRKDFKPDTYYSVVVAAIANITVSIYNGAIMYTAIHSSSHSIEKYICIYMQLLLFCVY